LRWKFALIKLRYSEPDLERPYRIPGGWLGIALMTIPLVAVICWSAYEEWVGDGGNDRWVLIAAFAFCLVAYIPGIFLRRYYERRGELGLPREWIEAEHGTDAS
jgi:amino acid transporter